MQCGGVDLPEFVAGLMRGVFEAIVKVSIERLDAYDELLASVAKPLDRFTLACSASQEGKMIAMDQLPSGLPAFR